jgi:hypothetical protein
MRLRKLAAPVALAVVTGLFVTDAKPAHADLWDELYVRNTGTSATHIHMKKGLNSYRLDPGETWSMFVDGTVIKFPQSAGSWRKGYPGQGYGRCLTRGWLLDHDFKWNPPNREEWYTIKTYSSGSC